MISETHKKTIQLIFDASVDANYLNAAKYIRIYCEQNDVSIEDAIKAIEEINFFRPEGITRFKKDINKK